jgi:hypothetical protein
MTSDDKPDAGNHDVGFDPELYRRKEPLHADLIPYLDLDDGLLRHPFVVQSIHDPERCAWVNKLYLRKKEEAEKALKKGDFHYYIFLHERPDRSEALARCTKKGLSGKSYWEAIAVVWMDSESIHQDLAQWKRHLAQWKRLWASPEPFRECAMNDKERTRLAELPSTFTVWRGTQHNRASRGLSWTL